jgi:predicted signal transduction protein with EAL and GGDEF domain
MNMSGEQVRAGLKKDEFVPFSQPVKMLHGGEVAGMEVLMRWFHPVLGIVPPGAFIATAKREGLIGESAKYLHIRGNIRTVGGEITIQFRCVETVMDVAEFRTQSTLGVQP